MNFPCLSSLSFCFIIIFKNHPQTIGSVDEWTRFDYYDFVLIFFLCVCMCVYCNLGRQGARAKSLTFFEEMRGRAAGTRERT